MQKRVCEILCLVSGGLFLLLALGLWSMLYSASNAPSASIIGGADAPTVMFLLGQPPVSGFFLATVVSLVTCIVTGVILLIPNKKS